VGVVIKRSEIFAFTVGSVIIIFRPARKKNGFVTATKLGTTNNYFVAATKNFAASNQMFC